MFLKILQNSSKDIYSLLVVLSSVSEIPKILFWFMSLELLLFELLFILEESLSFEEFIILR